MRRIICNCVEYPLYSKHNMRRIYIYQQKEWPEFTWDNEELSGLLGKVRNLQGRIVGRMESLGFDLQSEAALIALTQEVVKTTEIEGEILNPEQVRSSIARKLGLKRSGLIPSDRNVDGVVEMMLDATQNFSKPLSKDRLCAWHASLFPGGRSGMHKIITGKWRDDSTGPMQVVSGALGKEKIHFQAPPATTINREISMFIKWLNKENKSDPVIKAGLAHLWFVTIHPFEDGNGRIARAIADMLLTRADGIAQRYYSMSSQIRIERKEYYNILEKTQKGSLDVTPWLKWFLSCLLNAIMASDEILSRVMYKHNFWVTHAALPINERQKLLLNRLLDGFKGNLTTSKWARIAKCSHDTALRDIQYLIHKKILRKNPEGGRSTKYELAD